MTPPRPVSRQTLSRLPSYLAFLRTLPQTSTATISATAIAEALGQNDVQVRKDLASISSGGRPKVGYRTKDLIGAIERFLMQDHREKAAIVGVGNLGRALLSNSEFHRVGLDIAAAFDTNPDLVGTRVNGCPVHSLESLARVCRQQQIPIGIITVPGDHAQMVCDCLVEGGILAIWNFAPVHLSVPDQVLVQHENLVWSLNVLSKHLKSVLQTNNRMVSSNADPALIIRTAGLTRHQLNDNGGNPRG